MNKFRVMHRIMTETCTQTNRYDYNILATPIFFEGGCGGDVESSNEPLKSNVTCTYLTCVHHELRTVI